MMKIDVRKYMQDVPDIDHFLTVDELNNGLEDIANANSDIARWRRVGTSRLGEPISMLSIGSGSKNILLFACPHPNEPIGAMLVMHFARLLTEDRELLENLGFSWHLISCVDPDGTRLNEGWFRGPFTPEVYARNFYRPAGHEQVEWTFPSFYKKNFFDQTIPESEMLMRVIDELQPTLMGSLHNAGFGGAYYYLSRDVPEVHSTLLQLPEWESVPTRMGEAEVPYAQQFGPAIYKLLATSDSYDYEEANGGDMDDFTRGGSSSEYASRHGTLTVLIEMAYFDDPRVSDTTETEVLRRDAILEGINLSDKSYDLMKKHYDAVKNDLRANSPFESAVSSFINMQSKSSDTHKQWAMNDPSTNRKATVAELFTSDQQIKFYRLLTFGMLLRMLEGEVAIGNGTPVIRKHLLEAREDFERWVSELEKSIDLRVVPIRKLVSVQLGAILVLAEQMKSQL